MSPLDLKEFADQLRLSTNSEIVEFALEILDLIEFREEFDFAVGLVDECERWAETKFPDPSKILDWFEAKLCELDEKDEQIKKLNERVDELEADLEMSFAANAKLREPEPLDVTSSLCSLEYDL